MMVGLLPLTAWTKAQPKPQLDDGVDRWATSDTLSQLPLTAESTFPVATWWETFNDPTLNEWVAKALTDNPDLAVVEHRVAEATAMTSLAKSPLFPSLNVGSSYIWQQYGKNEFLFPLTKRTFNIYRLPIRANYQLDLFSKNRLAYKAQRTRQSGVMYQYLNARQTLAAHVASAYWNLLLADAQVNEQQALVSLASQQLDHTQALFDQQQIAADGLDASKQLLASQHAELTRLRANQAIAAHTLTVLAGGNPTNNPAVPRGNLSEVLLPDHLPVGLPAALVAHRADIAAIEAQMEAASLDVSVARKAYLPTFNINAQTGLAAIGFNNLFDWQSFSTVVNPAIDWPVFTGGARRAQSKIAKARYRQLLETYRSAVLRAFGDVEAALVDMAQHRQLLTDIGEQATATERIAQHDYERLTVGLVAQPQWITSELVRREYQKALAQEQTAYLVSYASLMQALGGGAMPDPSSTKAP